MFVSRVAVAGRDRSVLPEWLDWSSGDEEDAMNADGGEDVEDKSSPGRQSNHEVDSSPADLLASKDKGKDKQEQEQDQDKGNKPGKKRGNSSSSDPRSHRKIPEDVSGAKKSLPATPENQPVATASISSSSSPRQLSRHSTHSSGLGSSHKKVPEISSAQQLRRAKLAKRLAGWNR